jgi:hypothetical protein
MADPTKLILACDESGAMGYADQDEAYPGEVGVFAGILIPEECLERITPKFQEIYDLYKPASGKLHIADLPDHLKEALRRDVYGAIRDFQLPCFWYAIHVAGLHNWHIADAKQKLLEARGGKAPRVKRGSPRSNPASMHELLFLGLYAHLIAFLEERKRKELYIEVRSDQIDSPIRKNFEAIAKQLLSEDADGTKRTGLDTVTGQVVEGSIRVELKLPPEMQIKAVVRSLSINPVTEGDGLVLAADVLANSLNHLFKHRTNAERYGPLNTPKAVAAHPLAEHLDAFNDWGSGDHLGDGLYKHPKASK